MIITGNSNIDCFNRQGFTVTSEIERIRVYWVGALKIRHFYESRPSGEKVRRLFRNEPGWKVLSIGTHDIFHLFWAASQGRFESEFKAIAENYTAVFNELNEAGRFAWLVFPQPFHQLNFHNVPIKDKYDIARQFNRRIEEICAGRDIAVINPLRRILDKNGMPLSTYMQEDASHMNREGAQIYLEEIRQTTGLEITFSPGHLLFDPQSENESFCSLLLNNLNIAQVRTCTGEELKDALITSIRDRISEKDLYAEIHRDTELIDSRLLNTLDMVEIFSFASNLLALDIQFDADLWQLHTIDEIVDFLMSRKFAGNHHSEMDPIQPDFLLSLRGNFENPQERKKILDAERRISLMNDDLFSAFKENVVIASEGYICPYGIVLFWIALNEARRGDHPGALALLKRSCDPERRFPFLVSRSQYYERTWRENVAPYIWDRALDSVQLRELPNTVNAHEAATLMAYEEALSIAEKGDQGTAIRMLNDLLNKNPGFPPAHNDLGVLHWQSGDHDKALLHYERAVELTPDNVTYIKNLADFYYVVRHDQEKALTLYIKGMSLAPNDLELLSSLGRISLEQRQVSDARYFYERMLELDPKNKDASVGLEAVGRHLISNTYDEGSKACNETGEYLVSAIVSTYNSERFIRGCLEDLEAQTIADRIEIIVIDSFSQQNEGEVIKEMQSKFDNIRYIRTDKNETVYAAWNRGIKMASGKYITNANADDRHSFDAFEKMTRILEGSPEIALVYANVIITDRENETFDNHTPSGLYRWHDWDRNTLLTGVCFMGPQPMWRRSVHDEYGYFDESMITSGDYEFWLRISQTNDFYHIDSSLGLYLNSPQSIEHSNRLTQHEENNAIISLYNDASRKGLLLRYSLLEKIIEAVQNNKTELPDLLEKLLARLKDKTGLDPDNVDRQWRKVDQKNLAKCLASKDHSRAFPLLYTALLNGHKSYLDDLIQVYSRLVIQTMSWWRSQSGPARSCMGLPECVPGSTSIIIPVSTFTTLTKKCIESLRTLLSGPNEIILTTNDKNMPPWPKQLAAQSKYTVINNSIDDCCSRMVNRALKASSGQYILLLDGKTIMLQETYDRMLECFVHQPDTGIVLPMSSHATGNQQIPGAEKLSLPDFSAASQAYSARNRNRYVAAYEADSSCLLISRELLNKTGLLNEDIRDEYAAFNDLIMRAIIEEYQVSIASDSCVYQQDNRKRLKGVDKVFRGQWGTLNSQSPAGIKLSVHLAIKKARDHYGRGSLNDAVQAILDGIKLMPENKALYFCLADILFDAKLYDQAIEALESLPVSEKDSIRVIELLGYCSYMLGDEEKSNGYADRILSLNPASSRALDIKGLLANDRGDQDDAGIYFRKAIAYDPSFAQPYIHIGLMKWHNDANKHEAFDLIEKGFILSPETGDFSKLYHSTATHLQLFSRAEQVFREAFGLFPNNKHLSFLFTDVLLQLQKDSEAMDVIQKAIVAFGFDDDMLSAALAVRNKIGPLVIDSTRKPGTLSVCMITKNEEKYLARCLASILPVADEIIVVDTGSSDKTKELATIFGARVYDHLWNNDFSEARNASLERAKGAWILVHDADEVLSSRDYDRLRKIIDQETSHPKAYLMTTRTYTANTTLENWTLNDGEFPDEETAAGWCPTTKTRLFPNDAKVRFQNQVHELLEPSLNKAGIKIEYCPIPVHHYGKMDKERSLSRAEMYYELGRQKILKYQDTKALKELAIQAGELGKYKESLDLWNMYIQFKPDDEAAYFNMASHYLETGQFREAIDAARKAVAINPESPGALLVYATSSFCSGDIGEATHVLEDLVRKKPDFVTAAGALAAAYCLNGKAQDGLKLLDKMKRVGHDYGHAIYWLSKKMTQAGRKDHAKLLLKTVIDSDYNTLKDSVVLFETLR